MLNVKSNKTENNMLYLSPDKNHNPLVSFKSDGVASGAPFSPVFVYCTPESARNVLAKK